jgi:hypothetical protein
MEMRAKVLAAQSQFVGVAGMQLPPMPVIAWPHCIGLNLIYDLRLLIIFSSGLLLCILCLPAAAVEPEICLPTSVSNC